MRKNKYLSYAIFFVLQFPIGIASAQIAESLKSKNWVEAGGNRLLEVFYIPELIQIDQFGTAIILIKQILTQTIDNANSQISIIQMNCGTNQYALEYVEQYKGSNLDGQFLAGGRMPPPLMWNSINEGNAYFKLKSIVCR